jgi:hypothetical protein
MPATFLAMMQLPEDHIAGGVNTGGDHNGGVNGLFL